MGIKVNAPVAPTVKPPDGDSGAAVLKDLGKNTRLRSLKDQVLPRGAPGRQLPNPPKLENPPDAPGKLKSKTKNDFYKLGEKGNPGTFPTEGITTAGGVEYTVKGKSKFGGTLTDPNSATASVSILGGAGRVGGGFNDQKLIFDTSLGLPVGRNWSVDAKATAKTPINRRETGDVTTEASLTAPIGSNVKLKAGAKFVEAQRKSTSGAVLGVSVQSGKDQAFDGEFGVEQNRFDLSNKYSVTGGHKPDSNTGYKVKVETSAGSGTTFQVLFDKKF